jgi:hypothetical protein
MKNIKNKTLKTFRFLLHSYSKSATNFNSKYFIDGVEIEENIFKIKSRKRKFNKLIN